MKKTYILEHLGCANCAAKIERRVASLPGIEEATLTFATRQLRITAENPDAYLPQIQKIANSLEPDIQITDSSLRRRAAVTAFPSPEKHKPLHGDHQRGHGTCSHKHSHEEHRHDHCACSHEHSHEEHDHDHCACSHEHSHGEHCHDHCGSGITRTYTVENLDCANCAAKLERQINALPDVTSAVLTFATKQLRVTSENPDGLLLRLQTVCSSVEPDAKIIPKNSQRKTADVSPVRKSLPGVRNLSDNARNILTLAFGAILFAAGIVLEHLGISITSTLVFLGAYLVLGAHILITAAKNLIKGQIFDENFLMSIATLGAVVIREYPEAVGVMLFYRIGEFLEHKAVEKSRSQIMDAVDLRPETVTLAVGDDTRVIPAEDAKVGDLLIIKPGDRIPLDGVIVDGESRIDTSPITGEPVPVKAGCGDDVVSGCVNTSGVLKIRVEKALEESMVTRILDSVENAAASKPKIDRFITRFARVYTPFVVFLSLATAIIPSLITGQWRQWIYTALTFLVISCPCALVLSVPLAFFSGIGAGSRRGILFKGGVSLEAMKHISAVVMDKTGTITQGNFVLQEVLPVSGVSEEELLRLCASSEQTSTHPIANSIVSAAKERGIELLHPESAQEIAGHGICAVLPEATILCGNAKLMEQYHVSLPSLRSDSFGTQVLVAKDGKWIGSLVISDTVKRDAKSAVAKLKGLGITTVMLTGDTKESACKVAELTGIDEVHAKLLPEDKLSKLRQIRDAHGAVMFVGDGINDAPVLAGADVGAAMGSGADAAIEAADIVFMTSSMEAIPSSLAIARATNAVSCQNVVFALIVKAAVMILGLFGAASMWLAVFADTGVAMLCVLNSIRILYKKDH